MNSLKWSYVHIKVMLSTTTTIEVAYKSLWKGSCQGLCANPSKMGLAWSPQDCVQTPFKWVCIGVACKPLWKVIACVLCTNPSENGFDGAVHNSKRLHTNPLKKGLHANPSCMGVFARKWMKCSDLDRKTMFATHHPMGGVAGGKGSSSKKVLIGTAWKSNASNHHQHGSILLSSKTCLC